MPAAQASWCVSDNPPGSQMTAMACSFSYRVGLKLPASLRQPSRVKREVHSKGLHHRLAMHAKGYCFREMKGKATMTWGILSVHGQQTDSEEPLRRPRSVCTELKERLARHLLRAEGEQRRCLPATRYFRRVNLITHTVKD